MAVEWWCDLQQGRSNGTAHPKPRASRPHVPSPGVLDAVAVVHGSRCSSRSSSRRRNGNGRGTGTGSGGGGSGVVWQWWRW